MCITTATSFSLSMCSEYIIADDTVTIITAADVEDVEDFMEGND